MNLHACAENSLAETERVGNVDPWLEEIGLFPKSEQCQVEQSLLWSLCVSKPYSSVGFTLSSLVVTCYPGAQTRGTYPSMCTACVWNDTCMRKRLQVRARANPAERVCVSAWSECMKMCLCWQRTRNMCVRV